MVLAEKENMPGALPLQGKNVELEQKERLLNVSSSKIPVLCRSRLSPGLKQVQQVCSNAVKSKELKMSKVSSLSVPVLKPAAELFPKSSSREPLVEMQLSTSGHRNELEDGNANSKEARAVEFVPDPEALVSILSNTGLSSRVMSTTHKPSLARRVPLRGNRACSASSGTGHVSLYVAATAANPGRTSHLSGLASKGVGRSQSCGLSLNAQQLKTLSMALENLAPGVEAKPNQPMENLQAGKCKGSAAGPKTACPSSITDAGKVKQSNSAGSKETTGTSWAGEEFVPDPAAKASILLNVGVSHSALSTGSKLSLARRVPLKDVQKACAASGSLRGEDASFPGPRMSSPPTAKFGRVSCRSTQGLKGLEESGALGAQLPVTPGNRCSVVDYSLSGQARRVPVTQSRSLHFRSWRCEPFSSCPAKRSGTRCLTETPQTKWMGEPPTDVVSSKKEVHWEKIAVRLFNDGLQASAKKASALRVIPSDMGKLQRVEFFAQLLQQEISGGVDEVAPSLEELHKLLSVHCTPPFGTPKPDLVTTPPPDATAKLGEQVAVSATAVVPVPDTTLTMCNSQPACSAPSVCSLGPSPFCASSTGVSASSSSVAHFKQRLEDLLDASRRFHEDCLNDECAFYMSRVTAFAQPAVQRCKEPVAKMLDAQDTMHFIPISGPQSPLLEAERSSPT